MFWNFDYLKTHCMCHHSGLYVKLATTFTAVFQNIL